MEKTPPPAAESNLNNTYAWVLAIAPIVLTFIAYRLAIYWAIVAIVIGIITIALWFFDKAAIEKAGYKSENWVYIGLLLLPVYLFFRANKTEKKYGYAICCCALLLINSISNTVINLASL